MQRSKTPSAATQAMAENFQKSHQLSQVQREEKAQ